ncbi:hypothetical protein B0T17DRAFT_253466 [Bombardia bombarda]|uniref:Uncharacterized protein n=1 Tax=Bombardia bombarda TaxID=252184 RepID=A0AA39X043_9PEZI|nr:hypothetical protein B0T17DRAFT_253466 [Bombardia bombarda]
MGTKQWIVTRSDPYVGDYRVWGEPGCSAQNLGVGTVTESGLDTCKNFGDIVKAVNLTNVVDGCTFFVYSEIHCEGIRESIKKGSGCGNAIDVVWSSYQFTCDPIVPGN